MRIVLWAVLCVWSLVANAQSWGPRTLVVEPWVLQRLGVDTLMLAQAATDKPSDKKGDKGQEKPKPQPRVILKKEGAGVDAAGGGAHTGPSSMGGTPGTPSGSFTR